ncbi:alanine--tRNA ligase [Candidatus Bandiella euplotis]|uniref:Alanine--tRNA ligase n=1 Tax=Candidatus Bandiella euplotis TaxID=1664265 RepID=A0ABZ0UNA2_9RICK|nr:alanine--tRNA ligase [Candidatus Bandiella woodruffii]WPX96178.1 Alanine--tRNA ligase [Candidatus Bandiella woodruffii]
MESNNIRKSFLEYFQKNDHKVLSSSPLIPHNDPSLLFTNSGMVQFKNQFTGKENANFPRIATAQKCIRAGGKHNDLENVGYTARHHTFFEMLGNFSFGDYFKEKAIFYAWNYLTKELQVNKDRLYITVYHEDEEAFALWKKITGFHDAKIIKIRTADNFWSMGDFGPCGPCSEIFYDHGEKYVGGLPGTEDADGDRYIEIWNLVFMQFEKLTTGEQINLPKPSIDTGMGLERISAVMQGVNNNYDTDAFQVLIKASMEVSGNDRDITSHRVIADHISSSCFLLADGVLPCNEGRGYVLRRIMRRAMRHIHNIGYNGLMLHKVAIYLIESMKNAYPELSDARELITSTLKMEEEKFKETLSTGMKYLKQEINHIASGGVFDGKKAFKLYDTYGFPIDLTADILKEKNISLDQKEFENAMEEQKARARAAWAGSGESQTASIWFDVYQKFGATEFIRKDVVDFSAKIVAIVKDGNSVASVTAGDKVVIVTDQTCFYAESGGQVGDKGVIGCNEVYDTKLFVGHIHGHLTILNEDISVGDEVKMGVNSVIKNKTRANHSATHLLHYALRYVLGKHVVQRGSLVNDEKLRFDFTHNAALSLEELCQVELMVNGIITSNQSVQTNLMNIEKAKNMGAMALFGEKYEEDVRVISMGDSIELCGGTHVSATGDIGYFIIVSEESIAAGIRRIEAYTGKQAVVFSRNKTNRVEEVLKLLRCSEADISANIKGLQYNIKELQKNNEQYKVEALLSKLQEHKVSGVSVLSLRLQEKKIDLKSLYDSLRKNYQNSIIVVMNIDEINSKIGLLIGITKDLAQKYNAKLMIEQCFDIIGGKGGGNAEVAQASGMKIENIDDVLKAVENCI